MARSGPFASLLRVQLLRAAAFATACWAHGAQAGPPEQAPKHAPPQFEVWSGGEAFGGIWSLYGGATFAPFGSVRDDGFRIRGVAGYGGYDGGTVAFADLLVGYHAQFGPLTLKAFAGITRADHAAEEPLPAPRPAGLGGKGVVEAWWNVTDRLWASADLSWGWTSADMSRTSMRSVHSGRLRLGWRLWPEFSAGPEGGFAGARLEEDTTGSEDRDIGRLGGFVRYEWATGELSVSAGLVIDRLDGDGQLGPFGTVTVLTRF